MEGSYNYLGGLKTRCIFWFLRVDGPITWSLLSNEGVGVFLSAAVYSKLHFNFV